MELPRSSPNPSRARRTTTCSRVAQDGRASSGSGRSSGPTTTSAMGTRRAARADRRVGHAGRPGPRDQHDPARHADDVRDVPASRAAGDHRRQVDQMSGGRVELGSAPAGSTPSTRRTASRSRAPGSGSTGSRSSSRSSPACGRRRRASFTPRRRALPGHDSPALPKPAQDAGRRSSSAAWARSGRPSSPRGTPTSSTCRSSRSRTARAQYDRVRRGLRGDRPRPGTTCSSSNALVLCVGADEAELARRAEAIGHDVDDLRANGLAGTPARGRRQDRPVRRASAAAALPPGAGPLRPRPPAPGGRRRSCRTYDPVGR